MPACITTCQPASLPLSYQSACRQPTSQPASLLLNLLSTCLPACQRCQPTLPPASLPACIPVSRPGCRPASLPLSEPAYISASQAARGCQAAHVKDTCRSRADRRTLIKAQLSALNVATERGKSVMAEATHVSQCVHDQQRRLEAEDCDSIRCARSISCGRRRIRPPQCLVHARPHNFASQLPVEVSGTRSFYDWR